jgi:2-methylisocitrate lyase-like PEP mutase family enzyme
MKRSLKAAIEAGEFVIAPGLHDMIAAVVSNKVGFDFVYASGYWTTASAHGLPDAGIATYTQMLDRVATLVRTVNAGVIADADTGYGGLLNVHHTVRGYEDAGVIAIQIEDQEFPKKCGHTPFKRVVPTRDMVEKVQVACAARRSPETLIIARTDARQTDGFDGALKRGQASADAGADLVFVRRRNSRRSAIGLRSFRRQPGSPQRTPRKWRLQRSSRPARRCRRACRSFHSANSTP